MMFGIRGASILPLHVFDHHAISARQNGVGKAELLNAGGNLSNCTMFLSN
jgi:hypothetical protein